MDERKLIELISNKKELERRIKFYFRKKILSKKEFNKNEINGHIAKADHNVEFFQKQKETFGDWQIVGCYYTVYHMALALILSKNFFSKNHDATLCILLKPFSDIFTPKEIIGLNNIQLTNTDILFYVKSKEKREMASYSTKIAFHKEDIENLKHQTLEFTNKCKAILGEMQ